MLKQATFIWIVLFPFKYWQVLTIKYSLHEYCGEETTACTIYMFMESFISWILLTLMMPIGRIDITTYRSDGI